MDNKKKMSGKGTEGVPPNSMKTHRHSVKIDTVQIFPNVCQKSNIPQAQFTILWGPYILLTRDLSSLPKKHSAFQNKLQLTVSLMTEAQSNRI